MNPNQQLKKCLNLAIFLPILLIGILINVPPLLAHTRVEIDPYVIIVGWENEPVIVGERNALTFEITKNEVPVEGLESTLDASVLYAGRSFIGDFIPTTVDGLYSVEILPTVRGLYTVQLSGMIEDTEIDELIEPEEVLPANVLQFPESPPEARDLQAEIDELSNQISIARILAIVGVSLAVIGLVIAAIGLTRSRITRK
jgi:hypothetical protein